MCHKTKPNQTKLNKAKQGELAKKICIEIMAFYPQAPAFDTIRKYITTSIVSVKILRLFNYGLPLRSECIICVLCLESKYDYLGPLSRIRA